MGGASRAWMAVVLVFAGACGGTDGGRDVPPVADPGPSDPGIDHSDPGIVDPGPADPGPAPDVADDGTVDAGPCAPPAFAEACGPCDGQPRSWCGDGKTACFCGSNVCKTGEAIPFSRATACQANQACVDGTCRHACSLGPFVLGARVKSLKVVGPDEVASCPDLDHDGSPDSGLKDRAGAINAAIQQALASGTLGWALDAGGGIPPVLSFLYGHAGTAGTFTVGLESVDPATCKPFATAPAVAWSPAALLTEATDLPFLWPFQAGLQATLVGATLAGPGVTVVTGEGAGFSATKVRVSGYVTKGDLKPLTDSLQGQCPASPLCTALDAGPVYPDLDFEGDMTYDALSICLFVELEAVALLGEQGG